MNFDVIIKDGWMIMSPPYHQRHAEVWTRPGLNPRA